MPQQTHPLMLFTLRRYMASKLLLPAACWTSPLILRLYVIKKPIKSHTDFTTKSQESYVSSHLLYLELCPGLMTGMSTKKILAK